MTRTGPNRDASGVDRLDGVRGRDVRQRDADVEISTARARRAVESLRNRDGKVEIRSTRPEVDCNHIREIRRTRGRGESGECDRDDEKEHVARASGELNLSGQCLNCS